MNATIIVDCREPWPHPWFSSAEGLSYFSDNVTPVRGCLETGDLALAALPDGAIIERKTVTDLLACIGRERERFERELKRGRYVGRFMVIVEGTLAEVLAQSRGLHENAIIGTLAAWQRRYAPFAFCDTTKLAARIAEAFLCGQIREIERSATALTDLN